MKFIWKLALKLLLNLDNFLYRKITSLAMRYESVHPKHRLTRYHGFFVKNIEKGESVLDVGCGIGAVAYDVVMAGASEVLGIDMDEKAIEVAKRKFKAGNLSFTHGKAPDDVPRRHFDAVILSNVLEHVEDRTGLLREIKEKVKPRRFLIRVPQFERSWIVPLKKELGIEWRSDLTHKTEYTLESFREEVGETGLKIGYIEVRWGEIYAVCLPAESIS